MLISRSVSVPASISIGTVLLDHPPQTCGWRSDERFGSSATRIAMHYLSWGTPAPFGIATFRRALVTDRSELAAVPAQIAELLSKLTDDPTVWDSIADRYDLDLFCGLFMRTGNEGLSIYPPSLMALGARHIELGLDIYGGDDDGAGESATA